MKISSYVKHEVIGEGSFGCIFIPELPCTDVETLNRRVTGRQMVGKIFTYYDSRHPAIETEKKMARLVNKWDPNALYFGIPTKICKTTSEIVKKHPAAYQCSELNFFDRANLDQIVMPYYGLALDIYMKNYMTMFKRKFPVENFLPMIRNLLIGVSILQQNKVVHMDIKLNNVLFDNITARIIDFSLLRSYPEVYSSEANFKYRLEYSYFPYPLEFLLMYHYHFNKCNNCDIYHRYTSSISSFGNKAYRSFIKYHTVNEIIKTVKDLERWVQDTTNWVDIIAGRVNTIDVYSIGTLCIDMDEFLDFSNVSKSVKNNYIKFVKTISAIDCRQRPNAVEAIELLGRLFGFS